jgi:hypothetical protein
MVECQAEMLGVTRELLFPQGFMMAVDQSLVGIETTMAEYFNVPLGP